MKYCDYVKAKRDLIKPFYSCKCPSILSAFNKCKTEDEVLKKWGLLNIIDYHFDTDVVDQYDISNKESSALNTFFSKAWDICKSLENFEKSDSAIDEIRKYYISCMDIMFYIKTLVCSKTLNYKITDGTSYKKILKEFYYYYTKRQSFDGVEISNIDDNSVVNYDDATNEENNSITVYIISQSGEEIPLTLENINKGEYYKYFDIQTITTPGQKKRYIKSFNYKLSSFIYTDSYGEIVGGGKSIIYKLAKMIVDTFESFFSGEFYNYYEEYFKLYFYKTLTEKYRTKEIEDSIYKYVDLSSSMETIPYIYSHMDGKSGTKQYFKTFENSTELGLNCNKNVMIPFFKSEFEKGVLSFYINVNDLPDAFNGVKNYSNIDEYLISIKNSYLKLKNKKRKDVVFDEDSLEESETKKTIYQTQAEYIDENFDAISFEILKSLLYAVKPNYNFDITYNTDVQKNNLFELYKNSNCDFNVCDFLVNDKIKYALQFEDGTFYDSNTRSNVVKRYAKISVTNFVLKDLNYSYIELGAGYLNIQQLTKKMLDNDIMKNSAPEFKLENVSVTNNSKTKSFVLNDGVNDGDDYLDVTDALKSLKTNYEVRKNYVKPDFVTALEDGEVTIVHKTPISIGYNKNYEWVSGYASNGFISDEINYPQFKRTNISNIDGEYSINFQDMLKYDAPETIKEISFVDVQSGKEYTVEPISIDKKIMFLDDSYLELDNNYEFNKDYIANNTLYSFIESGVTSGQLNVAKNTKNGGYEVIIENESPGYTRITGDTLIIGKEYETSIGLISIKESGNEEYCLYLNATNDSTAKVVKATKLVIKKRLIIRPYDGVKEYLESIPKNGSKSIYISSFVQSEGNSVYGNLSLDELKKLK